MVTWFVAKIYDVFVERIMFSLCNECTSIDGLYRSYNLTWALKCRHVVCVKILISIGVPIVGDELTLYAAIGDTQLLDYVFTHISPQQLDHFIHMLWIYAIDHYNCDIMKFLQERNLNFGLAMAHAGECFASLIFMVETLHYVPTNRTIRSAIACGNVDILQYLHQYSITNHVERTLWNARDYLVFAIIRCQLGCLKYLLNTNSLVWKSDIIMSVYDLFPLNEAGYLIRNKVLVCLRYVHDTGFSWPSIICGDLLQDCVLLNCFSCFSQQVPFNLVFDIILERFKGKYRELIKLIISFARIFHKCDHCGRIEQVCRQQFIPCGACLSTFYCSDFCWVNGWLSTHKFVCYQ